jgi:hypothetical protein
VCARFTAHPNTKVMVGGAWRVCEVHSASKHSGHARGTFKHLRAFPAYTTAQSTYLKPSTAWRCAAAASSFCWSATFLQNSSNTVRRSLSLGSSRHLTPVNARGTGHYVPAGSLVLVRRHECTHVCPPPTPPGRAKHHASTCVSHHTLTPRAWCTSHPVPAWLQLSHTASRHRRRVPLLTPPHSKLHTPHSSLLTPSLPHSLTSHPCPAWL